MQQFLDCLQTSPLPVPVDLSEGEFLQSETVHHLGEVADFLGFDEKAVKREYHRLLNDGVTPWPEIGVRVFSNYWIVFIPVFAEFYREKIKPEVRSIPASWSREQVFQARGVFYLIDIVKFTPFSHREVLRMIQETPDAKRVTGVWRDPGKRNYVADIRTFFLWCYHRWHDIPLPVDEGKVVANG